MTKQTELQKKYLNSIHALMIPDEVKQLMLKERNEKRFHNANPKEIADVVCDELDVTLKKAILNTNIEATKYYHALCILYVELLINTLNNNMGVRQIITNWVKEFDNTINLKHFHTNNCVKYYIINRFQHPDELFVSKAIKVENRLIGIYDEKPRATLMGRPITFDMMQQMINDKKSSAR